MATRKETRDDNDNAIGLREKWEQHDKGNMAQCIEQGHIQRPLLRGADRDE